VPENASERQSHAYQRQKALEEFCSCLSMPAANEYCSGVATYSSSEATRNIINLLCHYQPNSIKLCYKKRKKYKKQKQKN
jgi:hypothetical protein